MEKATILDVNQKNLEICAEKLNQGELVSFPTETVYGLGANALDREACLKIFEMKGRPLTDPLIVHIAHKNEIYPLVQMDD